jgi:hypothetical protein
MLSTARRRNVVSRSSGPEMNVLSTSRNYSLARSSLAMVFSFPATTSGTTNPGTLESPTPSRRSPTMNASRSGNRPNRRVPTFTDSTPPTPTPIVLRFRFQGPRRLRQICCYCCRSEEFQRSYHDGYAAWEFSPDSSTLVSPPIPYLLEEIPIELCCKRS